MKLKPSTMKDVLRELVDRCEKCGSRDINISKYKFYEKKKKGFFDGVLVPTDPEEKKEYEKQRKLDQRDGLEIFYYCDRCSEYFKQFYDSRTLEIFLKTFKDKYE